MKKMVVMINAYDERSKEKVIRTVASCAGITTITMDSEEGKLTVIGEFDEMIILRKLKRRWHNAKMATFGPFDAKKEAETAKKEAETAAAAENKKKEESQRERLEAFHRSHRENPTTSLMHQHAIVCDHDHYYGCIIS